MRQIILILIHFLLSEAFLSSKQGSLWFPSSYYRSSSKSARKQQLFLSVEGLAKVDEENYIYSDGPKKIVVTGIGGVEEDEFPLQVLFEDKGWKQIVIGTSQVDLVRKKLLSRSAKYSGLYDHLQFQETDLSNSDQVASLLKDASAWIAFGLPRELVPTLASVAVKQEVPRVIFTVKLPKKEIAQQPALPEFTDAIELFKKHDSYFTGIRHGDIVSGPENLPYSIVNGSYACEEAVVPRGVLGRVVAELLHLQAACNTDCGISSSSIFAQSFLEMLRSSGATSSQEVALMFDGAFQQVMEESYKDSSVLRSEISKLSNKDSSLREKYDIPVEKYPLERLTPEEKKRVIHVEKGPRLGKTNYYFYSTLEHTSDEDLHKFTASTMHGREPRDPDFIQPASGKEVMFEKSAQIDPKQEQKDIERFLIKVWNHYTEYYGPLPMGRAAFMIKNFEQARIFLRNMKQRLLIEESLARIRQEATLRKVDHYHRKTSAAFTRLATYGQKQLENTASIYDVWVQYMTVLLDRTMNISKEKFKRRFNYITPVQQTMCLRQIANELRKKANLPVSNIIYDPSDAEIIIKKLKKEEKEYENQLNEENLSINLFQKYGYLFSSIPALRGTNEKLRYALKTFQQEQITKYKEANNIPSPIKKDLQLVDNTVKNKVNVRPYFGEDKRKEDYLVPSSPYPNSMKCI